MNRENNVLSFSKLTEQNIINLYTLKPYNFRKDILGEEKVLNNYKKIQKDLNYNFEKIIKPNQNHTNNVKIVEDNNLYETFDNVDGLITNKKNIALVTSLADCQGILLYDKENKVIGNIHSGWKGTLNKIIENAINLMLNNFNTKPENLEVYITPSILKCCFEVDEDVKELFINTFKDININNLITLGEIKNNKQKYFIDTVEINKRLMINLGLKKENIFESNICTKCNNEKMHSHRFEGELSGRNIALICLK